MKIAILGAGVEGKSAKEYFSHKYPESEIVVFNNFDAKLLATYNLSTFDIIIRSPSVPPRWLTQAGIDTWTSTTKIFFDQCPAPIIGITGTKGKGTTTSITAALLEALGKKVWLIGNIGNPVLDILDKIQPGDFVVYEMSSFQLWDLTASPHVSILLDIKPDHLDRHTDFDDYLNAKANICKFQDTNDYCIYDSNSKTTRQIVNKTAAHKIPYPLEQPPQLLSEALSHLQIPGEHNREDATLALLAVSASLGLTLDQLLEQYLPKIIACFENFHGLPHRIELVRELNGVLYYDDNYSSAFPALDVALQTFSDHPIVLIAGGKDRGLDLTETKSRLFSAKNLKHVILIGETAPELAKGLEAGRYDIANSLPEAVKLARIIAERIADEVSGNYDLCIPARDGTPNCQPIVIMSPGAASFDMFANFNERGNQFQAIVRGMQ